MSDIVKRLRWPGIHGSADHPVSVKLRVEAADEIERLQRRVTVLEMVINEEIDPFDCLDDANRMIVEGVNDAAHRQASALTSREGN